MVQIDTDAQHFVTEFGGHLLLNGGGRALAVTMHACCAARPSTTRSRAKSSCVLDLDILVVVPLSVCNGSFEVDASAVISAWCPTVPCGKMPRFQKAQHPTLLAFHASGSFGRRGTQALSFARFVPQRTARRHQDEDRHPPGGRPVVRPASRHCPGLLASSLLSHHF